MVTTPSLGKPSRLVAGDPIRFEPISGGGHVAILLDVGTGGIFHREFDGREWLTTVADHRAPGGQGHRLKRACAEAVEFEALLFISGPVGQVERMARNVANLLAKSHRRVRAALAMDEHGSRNA
jgi:hypothetical protein